MKSKNLKIGYSSRHTQKNPCTVPQIKMEGKWLEELGFFVGSIVMVEYEEGSILIRPLTEQETICQEYKKLKTQLTHKEKELHLMQSTYETLSKIAEPSDTYNNHSLNKSH